MITIYIKQYDEPPIPVTARIQWLANGKIKPELYRTPDNSCYEIKHIYEVTPLALLKNQGEGLRFRIKAIAIETPEPNCVNSLASHELYLYLADSFFSGSNIVDSRYQHEYKEFVPVTLEISPNGTYKLICFEARGAMYAVQKTILVEPRGSIFAGGIGIWHKVEIVKFDLECSDLCEKDARMAGLYFEINKWWVRIKAS